ncbi:unnamed protein product [Darwinula stevensoni]|uniref:MPN domain-containing protein n=1 Tax=Darwinula stevensoni TaxID=69355 RepID=A0A7R9FSB9_9CRUS|nr:unnamed protein product [Darwinula stevensoni]CAG0903218.1 unnamed protein product [Darwinula stevensoni]
MTIKTWAIEDRPREKLILKGKQALSDAELIAILIGSGVVGKSALDVTKAILHSVDNNLNELGKKTLSDLQKFAGIGEARAIIIIAALELGRRRQLSDVRERVRITTSRDAYNVIAPLLIDLQHEEFWMLLLNRNNEVTARHKISSGGTSATVVDMKMIFRPALESLAAAIVVMHNHPSGNLQPSKSDIDLTQKIKAAGASLDITLLDHLIVSERGYYSFADEAML